MANLAEKKPEKSESNFGEIGIFGENGKSSAKASAKRVPLKAAILTNKAKIRQSYFRHIGQNLPLSERFIWTSLNDSPNL